MPNKTWYMRLRSQKEFARQEAAIEGVRRRGVLEAEQVRAGRGRQQEVLKAEQARVRLERAPSDWKRAPSDL